MRVKQIEANPVGRDFVVGDLHGCYELLLQALQQVAFRSERDRLFSVGDLIDRGPDSLACLSLLGEEWFYAVRGNHEQMMINALCHQDPLQEKLWFYNGGGWSRSWDRTRLVSLAERLRLVLPLALELATPWGRVGIVHADPGPDWQALDTVDPEVLLWSREKILHSRRECCSGIDMVVVGHTPIQQPTLLGNVLYVDTGAYCTGNLTLLPVESVLQLKKLDPSTGRASHAA